MGGLPSRRALKPVAPLLFLALFLLVLGAPAGAQTQSDEALFKKIEANLICVADGCNMYLASCDNLAAQEMRGTIRERLAAGDSEQAVYAYFQAIYGEEVMAAPPPEKPFNIAAWVTPFVAIVIGGLVIYFALDRWVFNRQAAIGPEFEATVEVAQYRKQLEEEVKKYL